VEFDDMIGTFIRSLRLFYCFLVKTNTRNDLERGSGQFISRCAPSCLWFLIFGARCRAASAMCQTPLADENRIGRGWTAFTTSERLKRRLLRHDFGLVVLYS